MDALLARKQELLQGSFQFHFLIGPIDVEIARLRCATVPPPAPPPPPPAKEKAENTLQKASRAPPAPAVGESSSEKLRRPQVTVLKDDTRNRFLHDAIEDLRHARAQLEQCETTLHRLRNETQAFRVTEVIKRAQDKKGELERQIVVYAKRVEDIEEGRCDEEFLVIINANMERTNRPRRRAPPPPPPPPPPARRRHMFRAAPPVPGKDFAYEKYLTNCDKFPQHMRDKLKHMPNNQGFLYRDVAWYGNLPERPGPTVLTERHDLGGGAFEIWEHTFTPNSYVIYKRGRRGGQKQIVRRIK